MGRELVTVKSVQVTQDDDGRVHFITGAAVDADGANGQSTHPLSGKPLFAYAPGDTGLDLLANAGYPDFPNDYPDVLVCSGSKHPIRFVAGEPPVTGYHSKTAYEEPDAISDRDKYLDSVSVPYMVVNPLVRQKAKGVVLGCKARISYLGLTVDCVVGDVSGARTIGEMSIAAADALGIDSNPRTGGLEAKEVTYEFWPDVPAIINSRQFHLIPA